MGQSVSNCNSGRDGNSTAVSNSNNNTVNSNGNKIKSLVSLFSSVFGSKESSKVIANSSCNNRNNSHVSQNNNQRSRRCKPSVVVDVIRSHCLYNSETSEIIVNDNDCDSFCFSKQQQQQQRQGQHIFNCNKFIKSTAVVTDAANCHNLPGKSISNSLSCYNLKSSKITDDITIIQSISASIDKVKPQIDEINDKCSSGNQYKNAARRINGPRGDANDCIHENVEEDDDEDLDDELERISDYDDRARPESVALNTVSSPAFIDDEVDETDGDDEDSSIIEEPHDDDDDEPHHVNSAFLMHHNVTPVDSTASKNTHLASNSSSATASVDSSTCTSTGRQSSVNTIDSTLPLNQLNNLMDNVSYKNVLNQENHMFDPRLDSAIDRKCKSSITCASTLSEKMMDSENVTVNPPVNASTLRPFVFLTRSSHTVHPLLPTTAPIHGILKHQVNCASIVTSTGASLHSQTQLSHEKSLDPSEPVTVQVSPLVNHSNSHVTGTAGNGGPLIGANNRPAVIQASTSDLLRAISCYLEREYVWPLARSGSDAIADLVTYSSSDVVLWLRSVDRALLVQGWQDLAFISPSNLVFLFLLLRESLCDINFTSLSHLKYSVLSCLYLAYSYEGNEISYPLKPFLCDGDTRGAFFTRVLSIVSKSSSSMLLMNSDPSFFTSVFTHLLQYSPEHMNRSTIVPPSITIVPSHHHQQQQKHHIQYNQQQIAFHSNNTLKYSGNQTQHSSKLQSQVHPQQQQQQQQQPHRLILRPLQVISDAKVA